MSKRECPKCQSSMAEGWVLDSAHGGARAVSSWVEGAPDRKWWGIQLGKIKPLDIQSWRCKRCGYLEQYALAPTR